jgi:hypothetical protein
MFISRKNRQREREDLAALTVMLETLLDASILASAHIVRGMTHDMEADAFAAVDEAGFELKWSSDYVLGRLAEMGVTVDLTNG